MNPRSRRTHLLGLGLSGILLLSLTACGSDKTPEEFITPTPTSTSSSGQTTTSPTGEETTTAPAEETPETTVPQETVDLQAPFGLAGLDSVAIDPEVQEAFPDLDVTTIAPVTMNMLETSLGLEDVWQDGPREIIDYEGIRDFVTPALWDKMAADFGTESSIAEAVTPGRAAAVDLTTPEGKPFQAAAQVPSGISAVLPTVHLASDSDFFGDPLPRAEVFTTYWLFLDGESEGASARTAYKFDVRLFMVPSGDGGWLLDEIITNNIEVAAL